MQGEVRKRQPQKLPHRNNDVYVTKKTNFEAQMKRCQKLLESGSEVWIHGLGVAVDRAVSLALRLKSKGLGTVEIAPYTSTEELVDDVEPDNDDQDPETSVRHNSAIHIRVFHPEPAESSNTAGE